MIEFDILAAIYEWNWWEILKTGASVATAFGLILTFISLRGTRRQHQVSVLSSIQDTWIAIYPTRNTLLARHYSPAEWEVREPKDILSCSEWLDIVGPVANFYEFLGVLVYRGYVRPETLFVLVTVDKITRQNADPLISRLRQTYRADLYVFWDYLIDMWDKHPATVPRGYEAKASLPSQTRPLVSAQAVVP